MKTLLMIAVLLIITPMSQAQRVAHINTNELLDLMPEKLAAQNELTIIRVELERHLQSMEIKFQEAYTEIAEHSEGWSPVVIKMKEDQIIQMQHAIEEFQVSAQQELERREVELFEPIIAKAKAAINAVASKEGYDYIIDSSIGSLLVMPNNRDIIDLVQNELGIVIIE
ncbi:MAG: OmpH family outer membrane protein [Crocinitomicaceae bacterium]|nr:OmpH family outer membrane protein [Crocinitomicaceae bacterium]